jgi:dTDP-4-amino-4,6-dideoxygalactose transaminase
VSSREFILGGELKKFEDHFARFTGTRFAVGVSTGLDALSLSLRVLEIGKGDEVVVPAHTFIATALAVSQTGAKPVFCDVDPSSLMIDGARLNRAITRKTRAVIPVHIYGCPAPMDSILRIARKKKISVIEDACQAHGASVGGKKCGNLGLLGCFSFYPSKNLGAFGDGGMITTNDAALYQKLLKLRNYGSTVKYHHETAGFNQRLDTLQAAILDVKLPHLNGWNKKRVALAKRYDTKLGGIRQIELPDAGKGVYHLYVIRTEQRDALKSYLEKKGVGTGIHYPVPMHLQGAYRGLGYKRGDLPVAEHAARTVLSLPMYPEMPFRFVDIVAENIRSFFNA